MCVDSDREKKKKKTKKKKKNICNVFELLQVDDWQRFDAHTRRDVDAATSTEHIEISHNGNKHRKQRLAMYRHIASHTQRLCAGAAHCACTDAVRCSGGGGRVGLATIFGTANAAIEIPGALADDDGG
jgi:hypothetical protein